MKISSFLENVRTAIQLYILKTRSAFSCASKLYSEGSIGKTLSNSSVKSANGKKNLSLAPMETATEPPQLKRPIDPCVPISCDFGVKGDHWKGGMHRGVDFACSVGTPVLAAWDGIVAFAGNAGDGFGTYVKLIHSWHGLTFRTYYAHLLEAIVYNGKELSTSDIIGKSGNSGNVTGPHLHFELRVYNESVKPTFFDEEGVKSA